jgi:hypothetical protein
MDAAPVPPEVVVAQGAEHMEHDPPVSCFCQSCLHITFQIETVFFWAVWSTDMQCGESPPNGSPRCHRNRSQPGMEIHEPKLPGIPHELIQGENRVRRGVNAGGYRDEDF